MGPQWFHDDDFHIRLPEWLSDDVRKFYGDGDVGVGFAQGLASFLTVRGLRVVGTHTQANVFTSNTFS